MHYHEAEEFLLSLRPGKIELNLGRLKKVLRGLGLNEPNFRVVLVAGTNGKGSVIAMAEALLSPYLKLGAFLKPHIFTVRERVRISGNTISEELFCQAVCTLREYIQRTKEEVTFFEATLLVALIAFRLERVKLALIEVGLGGRFDAANSLPRILSVITSISHDHENYLGSTLTEIAFEKAGIFHKAPVILSRALDGKPFGAKELLCKLASLRGAQTWELKFQAEKVSGSIREHLQRIKVLPKNVASGSNLLIPKEISLNLLGAFQAHNLEVALTLADALIELGVVKERFQVPSFIKAKYRGRFEVQRYGEGTAIFDAAHNVESFHALRSTLEEYFPREERFLLLFGCQEGKEPRRLLNQISHRVSAVIPISLPILHPMSEEQLITSISDAGLQIECACQTFEKKIDYATDFAKEGGKVLVAGSIYYLGPIMEGFGFGSARVPRLNM